MNGELTIEALNDVVGGCDGPVLAAVLNGMKDSFDKGGYIWGDDGYNGANFYAGGNKVTVDHNVC